MILRPSGSCATSRIGDWEADTIIGANHKGVVMSHVERTSKYNAASFRKAALNQNSIPLSKTVNTA